VPALQIGVAVLMMPEFPAHGLHGEDCTISPICSRSGTPWLQNAGSRKTRLFHICDSNLGYSGSSSIFFYLTKIYRDRTTDGPDLKRASNT
jgi:hypothetical protein